MKNLIINEELKNLLPPLSAEEFAGLEASILKDGCLSALAVWKNTVIDGHHRHEICTKHNLPFDVKYLEFENIDDVKLWMWSHQDCRRNLTKFGRVEFALKIKDVIAIQSKERQGTRNDLKASNFVQNSARSQRTRQQVAAFAGVSHDTVDRVEYILSHADGETINALRWGRKDISINKVFTDLKAAIDSSKTAKPQKARELSVTSKTVSIKAADKEQATASAHSMVHKTPDTNSDPTQSQNDGLEKTTVAECQSPSPNPHSESQLENEYYMTLSQTEEKDAQTGKTISITSQCLVLSNPERLIAGLFSAFNVQYREKLVHDLMVKIRTDDGEETARRIMMDLNGLFADSGK